LSAATLELRGVAVEVTGRRLLNNIGLAVPAGECVAIMGPSGVGKTSLLNCIAGIAAPASGSVLVDGVEVSAMSSQGRAAFRLRRMGLVFQFGELLPELTVAENVALPSRLMGMTREAAADRAMPLLARFGLADRAGSHPQELSGGQQQLVGIARALAHEPVLVLADEPTGMLDEANTARVADLLIRASRELGAATVVVTHDRNVASRADRMLAVADGSLTVTGGSSVTNPDEPVAEPSL
jgi:putative ABC transport system ATP-binding protein